MAFFVDLDVPTVTPKTAKEHPTNSPNASIAALRSEEIRAATSSPRATEAFAKKKKAIHTSKNCVLLKKKMMNKRARKKLIKKFIPTNISNQDNSSDPSDKPIMRMSSRCLCERSLEV
mmetsp:Transcript_46555/g.104324  ORF Transcript_46555/g.104324 Transcript_46555/m.104324 type:complete len:118 (+) Transcript_46555:4517-4870(+)